MRVFERFETPPQALGAGILIQPTGLTALRVLGIEKEILAKGARIDQLYGVNHKNRAAVDLTYADWRRDAFGVGLHRGCCSSPLEGGDECRCGYRHRP